MVSKRLFDPGYDMKKVRLILTIIESISPDRCRMQTHRDNKECFPCLVYRLVHSITPCGKNHKYSSKVYKDSRNTYRQLVKQKMV